MRYAVLRDLDDPKLRPIALVIEHHDAVRVSWAVECGLRTVYDKAYRVAEPDGHKHEYGPGSAHYFDHVLASLSRSFAIDEVDRRDVLDVREIVDLYLEKVAIPRAARRGAYGGGDIEIEGPERTTVYGEPRRQYALAGVGGDEFLSHAA